VTGVPVHDPRSGSGRAACPATAAGTAELPTAPRRLRRSLGFLATASLSIGVMAPTLAMSITGASAAHLIGRAAPLAFLCAAVGVAVVAYGFIRLAAEFSSAGSVYAFVGETLGPRAGFLAGWALLGTYLVFPPVSIAGVAIFGQALLRTVRLAPGTDWFVIAVAAGIAIWLLAARGISPVTRSLLFFEGASVLLILVLMVVIVARLAVGDAPAGQRLSLEIVRWPAGVPVSALVLAATSGFLAFAGFESAGSLGEESRWPTWAIPRAIVTAVVFGAVFYVTCMTVQTLGFGTDPGGVRAFAGSSAPLGDLAISYVGRWLAAALDVGAMLSAVGAGLGGVVVGSRMMFAFARDGLVPRLLAWIAPGTRTPARALAVEMVFGLSTLAAFRIAGTPPIRVFFYLATIGVLNLLVMYALTNVAAGRLPRRRGRRRDVVLPGLGGLTAGYVLYRNVWPVPPTPFDVLPYVVAAWLVVGVLLAVGLVRPRGQR